MSEQRPHSSRVLALIFYPLAAGAYAALWWWRPPATCGWVAYMTEACSAPDTARFVDTAYLAAALAAAWYPTLWLYRAWRRRPARRT